MEEKNNSSAPSDDELRTAYEAEFPRAVWDPVAGGYTEAIHTYALVGWKAAVRRFVLVIQPAEPAQGGLTDDVRQLLQEFVDYHTEPAGVTPELIRDGKRFGAFLSGVEAREKDMVDRARAVLARHTAPTATAPDRSEFERQARYQGAKDFTLCDENMACRNGWLPATYHEPMTELAWRVWANKPAPTVASVLQADGFKKFDLTDYSVAVNYSNGTSTSILSAAPQEQPVSRECGQCDGTGRFNSDPEDANQEDDCPLCAGTGRAASLAAVPKGRDTIERAAWILESYHEYLQRLSPINFDEHPYLPEIEGTAKDLRAMLAAAPAPAEGTEP